MPISKMFKKRKTISSSRIHSWNKVVFI